MAASRVPGAHVESHAVQRIGWLRAAVLGANDGIVSTASLIIGIAASSASHGTIMVSGLAGLVAGAMSMAAGEYVSVSSQADTEAADLAREKSELAADPAHELEELTGIYITRGLFPDLSRTVAEAMTAHDALATHARDELGLAEMHRARPGQAALTSAATFSIGAALPVAAAAMLPGGALIIGVSIASLMFLMLLGGIGARAGGAPIVRAVARVAFWGALAMIVTAAIGRLFGTAVS